MAQDLISRPIPSSQYYFERYLSPQKRQSARTLKPRIVDFELTSKCGGSCTYCYASSPYFVGEHMATDTALRLVDDLVTLGVTQVQWCGGDPILHPDWERIVEHAGQRGINNSVFTAGVISERTARALSDLTNLHVIGINFDTVEPADFARTHRDGRLLDMKLGAWQRLLDAGFHSSRIMPCLTLTKPVAQSIERTLDFLVDEMKAGYVPMFVYHPIGKGVDPGFIPDRDEIRRAYEYRARKLGEHWLRIGPTECGRYYCKSKFHITYDGRVLPCAVLYDFEVGNVNDTSLRELVEGNVGRLCYDFEITGACAKCADRDVCWGCRANAYFYSGDITASDPMCWKNDDVPTRNLPHGPAACQQP